MSINGKSNSLDRNASSANRTRRNFQRLTKSSALGSIVVTPPLNNSGGVISLNINAAGGIYNNSGLSIKLADTSLVTNSSGLAVNLAANGGLETSSGVLVRGFRTSVTTTLVADGDTYYDTALNAPFVQVDTITQAIGGKLFANTANSATLSNVTALTPFNVTYTLPANYFTVGKTVRVYFIGEFTTTGTKTMLVNLYFNGHFVGGPNSTPVASTNARIAIECDVTCWTTGTSATFGRCGLFFQENQVNSSANVLGPVGGSTITADTTVAITVQVQAQFGAGSTSESIFLHQLIVEAIN